MTSSTLIKLIESYIDKPTSDKIEALEDWLAREKRKAQLEALDRVESLDVHMSYDNGQPCYLVYDVRNAILTD